MAEASTIKLSEISKKFKITGKDMIARLAEYGVDIKSTSTMLTEEQISLIFDIYTQQNEMTMEEILKQRDEDVKADSKGEDKK
ncbi:MAG: translation initiation factor IF-2 N-terminal domain-containing protein, partial [Oscillospiraceae bacterium]|nr:translation initiation factor IF-2 N-terminal domain-containing protein [Oscillospiraceae bacterium]